MSEAALLVVAVGIWLTAITALRPTMPTRRGSGRSGNPATRYAKGDTR